MHLCVLAEASSVTCAQLSTQNCQAKPSLLDSSNVRALSTPTKQLLACAKGDLMTAAFTHQCRVSHASMHGGQHCSGVGMQT